MISRRDHDPLRDRNMIVFKRRHARDVILNPIYDVFELVDEFCIVVVSTIPTTSQILRQRAFGGQTRTVARQ